MALTYQLNVLVVLSVASLFGLLSAAPISDEIDYYDDPVSDSQQHVTTTTSAPSRPELLCEKNNTIGTKTKIDPIKEDIASLMAQYYDWGKLLSPAPVAIGILGQLILLANRVKDFSITSDPAKIFKHIEYPDSFRTTLLQISQRGYKAFLTAHGNMDAIRMHNEGLPIVIKEAVRYLTSGNQRVIHFRLHFTLNRIKWVIDKSEKLIKQVIDEFKFAESLILETELAISSTKSVKTIKLQDILFEIKLNNQSKEFSEKESLILLQKDTEMKEMLNRLEYRKGHLHITTSFHNCPLGFGHVQFTINLAKDWIQEMGEDLYKKHGKFLKDTSQTWRYSYSNKFLDSDTCTQNNSQQLYDLLMAIDQYRQKYQHWQNSTTLLFDGSSTIQNFEVLLKTITECSGTISVIQKGNILVKNMKNAFRSSDKKIPPPLKTEMDEFANSINNARTAADNITEKSDRKVEVLTKSAWEIYEVSKRHQLEQLDSMSKTVEAIIELNNNLKEIRRNKTQQILNKITSLDITKVDVENVIQVLKEGLEEIGKLKNHWGQLIQFFQKIQTVFDEAFRHSTNLVQFAEMLHPKGTTGVNMTTSEDFLLDDTTVKLIRDEFEKSNEAVLLVHGISEMYVNVSNLYIKDRFVILNSINSLKINDNDATGEKLKQQQVKLITDTKAASEGIENYIKADENRLREALQTRHKELLIEFRRMRLCLNKTGLTEDRDWFQITYNNSKVIEVSSKNQVQMRDSNGGDNQLWYLDREQIIRSVTTNFCLTSNDSTKHVTVERCRGKSINQKWTLKDNMIINSKESDRSLDAFNPKNINEARIVEIKTKETNQLWKKRFL